MTSPEEAWRVPTFTDHDAAFDAYYDSLDWEGEPRAIPVDFTEPDPKPEIVTVDPGDYL